MKNLTPEQKKMEREYSRLNRVIESARKGQLFAQKTSALIPEQLAKYQAFYDEYQSKINTAEARMRELKASAQETI